MNLRPNAVALATTAVGVAVGIAAEHTILKHRRRSDRESAQKFGSRRGVRSRKIARGDGAYLFIEEAGPRAGKGAVFVHGSALRTDAWHYQLGGIDSHRLVFYDLRGHGLSRPKGDSPYTIETMSADLAAVVDDSGLDEVVVVGHSVGGMVALDFALQELKRPDPRIRGLVLLNTTYAPAVETLAGGAAIARLERVTRRPFDVVGSQAGSIEYLRKLIKPTDPVFWTVAIAAFGPRASARQVDFAYDMLAETPADVIFDLIRSFRDFDVRERLAEVTVPALVVGGRHDRLTVSRASEYLANHLPDARLVLLDDCGHLAMMECWQEVNRMILEFFGETLSREPVREAPGVASPP
jgi:pimeloyl-ACP methyl ester carboxylesterase